MSRSSLKSSSTCRNGVFPRCGIGACLGACALVVCLCVPTSALDSERDISQYLRNRWGSAQGFPGGPVHGITQSEDGYLWIAAERGLVRFDGLTFRLFQPSAQSPGTGPTVLGVSPDQDGSVWARLRGPAVFRMRRGQFEDPPSIEGRPESVITAMIRSRNGGTLMATLGQGVIAYRNGRFETLAVASLIPLSFAISIAESADGTVWAGTRDTGLLRIESERVARITEGLPDLKINCLLADDDGALWIGTDKGVARWHRGEITRTGVPADLLALPALAMLRDRDSNMWIAAGRRGLLRIDRRGVTRQYGQEDGLLGDVTTLFEDRDGNLWIGTSGGLERLRDAVFTTYSSAQGFPSDSTGPVYVDGEDRTWFAPASGGLFWWRDGQVGRITEDGLGTDVVYSIGGGDGDREVWVGRQRGGLSRVRLQDSGATVDRFTQADGLAQDSVYAVHRARDGAVWAGTLSGGASRLKDGVFTNYGTGNGLSSNTVTSILETADGTMWFATPNGVSAFSRGGWRRYTTADGLPSNDVNVLMGDSKGLVWAGTAAGVAIFDAGQVSLPPDVPAALRGPILGMAEDQVGTFWISMSERVLQVNRDGLVHGVLGEDDLREYGVADGLLAIEGVKRHRSVTIDGRGRIWFSMLRGLSMVDPAGFDQRTKPALTHVEELSADGSPVDLTKAPRISSNQRRVVLSYAGLSLGVPERVRYRYRLEPFDREWSEAVAERQAVYTNLSPGPYVFRVMASNSEGRWNGEEAMLSFEVEPMLWQTTWFRLSAVAVCFVAGWGIYRVRVMRMARQLNMRFEERLAERTRIAQELHDTLLQGFLSASMQLHVAAEAVPPDSPARKLLSHVQQLMSRVIDEGRNAVRGLRAAPGTGNDLEEAFARIPAEMAISDQVNFHVYVDGHVRPLHPMIRDEMYRIGREAAVNAFRHSNGTHIEIELEYSPQHVRMLVRDDGRGIDEEVLRTGRDGHWGLSGMRERAQRIGAAFKVWTRAGAGTEVELTVPNQVAFQATPKNRESSEASAPRAETLANRRSTEPTRHS
jgi:signal transduction histidine kinase/ligand-binding sensor domain-containing protein